MTLLWLDYIGVFVFAITGALLASRKQMDPFGFIVLAAMPAVGGGTLRDLILGTPVFWIDDTRYVYLVLGAALLTFFGYRYLGRVGRVLVWFDAVGLSVFCVLGALKALAVTGDPVIAVMMGVMTAVAGGIVRDVIANEVPLILQKELYAIAAFTGALVCVLMTRYELPYAQWAGVASALLIRSLGIVTGLSLPQARGKD